MKTVTVKIDKKGNARTELSGFHGAGCQKVVDALKSIGNSHTETNKPEFFDNQANSQSLVNG